MSHKARKDREGRYFHFSDLLVILLCLLGAAAGLNLFRFDLNKTLDAQNEQPVGTISIKNNNVQRRFLDRVLWDRLALESPVYLEDIVRVAESSTATLHIEGNHIDLNENTLIRIQRSPDEKGSIQIELAQGGMDIVSDAGGKPLMLSIMGRRVEVGPGTVLNAAAAEDGSIAVQVTKGSAVFVEENQAQTQTQAQTQPQERELEAGTMIALDNAGVEKKDPAAVVMLPRPNARFLKSDPAPLAVAFSWNRINLDEGNTLKLEIAGNKSFTRDLQVIETPDNAAEAALDAGLWYWRLTYDDAMLSAGQLTVADASGPVPISPVRDRLFSYQTSLPQIRFQWTEVAEATSYLLEVSNNPDFTDPVINKQTAAAYFVDSSLGPGTWYWRVMAAFPPVYEGSSAFSPAASFRIEQTEEPIEPVWPEPVAAEVPAEEPVEEPVVEEPPPVVQPPPPPVVQPPPAPKVELPPPPLAAPANRLPPTGSRIGIAELRTQRSIDFKWSAVPGANAYIFTLYQQDSGGRRQIVRVGPENRTSWTLDNVSMLDRGTFVWQVEAVNMGRNGTIGRQGTIGENTFVLDIPLPNRPSVRVEQTESPYDN